MLHGIILLRHDLFYKEKYMKTKTRNTLLSITEGGIMIALAVLLELSLRFWEMPNGGAITASIVPIIFYSYRRGPLMGTLAGLAWSVLQITIGGWYTPPANTALAVFLCVMLDYVIAFTVAGTAVLFAKLFGKLRIAGYVAGAAIVGFLRYMSSFLSGMLVWGSYTPEGMSVWWYSLSYNGTYMIPNMIIAAVLIGIICTAVDPLTLRRYKKPA